MVSWRAFPSLPPTLRAQNPLSFPFQTPTTTGSPDSVGVRWNLNFIGNVGEQTKYVLISAIILVLFSPFFLDSLLVTDSGFI